MIHKSSAKAWLSETIKKVPLVGKVYVQREELRGALNELWTSAGHFYSPIPSVKDLQKREQRVFDQAPTPESIDFKVDTQLVWLHELKAYYDDQPFHSSPRGTLRYCFENNAFSYFDAIILQGMLRHLKPQRIIEVGSGYSSCIFLVINELAESLDAETIVPRRPVLHCGIQLKAYMRG